MKRGTPDHPKTLRLMEELHCSKVVAVGVLELLWHFTSTYAPRGDIGRFTPVQIAKAIGWDGDPCGLISVLTSCRWLDRYRRNGLLVHDWPEHADDAVHMSLARRGIRFADGTVPSMRRFSGQERKKLEAAFRAHAVRTKSAPPEPEPEPANRTPPKPPAKPSDGTTPPAPPAVAGGSLAEEQVTKERLQTKAKSRNRFEQIRQFAIHEGERPTDEQLDKFRAWVRSGYTLAEMQRRIELGEHLAHAPPL